MAQQLYFSRDTRMFIQFRDTTENTELPADLGKGALWEIPVLDGYSFSQTTNTSEIALSEMESSAGISRRGRRMFTDSLAPAEWSFSTYVRPFQSVGQGAVPTGVKAAEESGGTDVHAVEEALWASTFGADKYVPGTSTFRRNVQPVSGSESDVITPAANTSTIVINESNRSALHSFTLWFLIDTSTARPLLYRMPEAIVNEVSIDFDVDGIATLNWSGFSKEIQDNSEKLSVSSGMPASNTGRVGSTQMVLGDLVIDTSNTRAVSIVKTVNAGASLVAATQAIDEAITSTKNFIRNRLTGVTIEAADAADKVAGVFPGASATLTAATQANPIVITGAAHGFSTGDSIKVLGDSNINTSSGSAVDPIGGGLSHIVTKITADTFSIPVNGSSNVVGGGGFSSSGCVASNGKYSLTLTGGSFNIGNNITYLVPEELGAINKPLEHVTGTRTATGNATCYLTLEDTDTSNGTSRQFFNDLVGTGAMAKVVNKFKVTMDVGGTAAASDTTNPALTISFPTAHIEVPSHSIEDVISLETSFTALPTDFGSANEITSVVYRPPSTY